MQDVYERLDRERAEAKKNRERAEEVSLLVPKTEADLVVEVQAKTGVHPRSVGKNKRELSKLLYATYPDRDVFFGAFMLAVRVGITPEARYGMPNATSVNRYYNQAKKGAMASRLAKRYFK
jgi:hypothetical protein